MSEPSIIQTPEPPGTASGGGTPLDPAQKRLTVLAESSRAFGAARLDLQEVLETVTRTVAETLGDACVVWLLDEAGEWLSPAACHHRDPRVHPHLAALVTSERFRLGEGQVGRVAQTGEAVFFSRTPGDLRDRIKPEFVPYLERFGIASLVIVPLRLRSRTVGALMISRDRPDLPYAPEDQELLQELADRAAVAIENARLFQESERAEARLLLLAEASETLLAQLDPQATLSAILDLAGRLFQADAYAVWREDPGAGLWSAVRQIGLPDGFPLTTPSTGQAIPDAPVCIPDVNAEPFVASRWEVYRRHGIRSMLCLPLRLFDLPTGTIVFYYRQPRRFSQADVRVGTALANLAASAITTSELYEEQRRMRAEAESARQRLWFLAEAGSILASSLDYAATLEELARLVVPQLADWCAVHLAEPGGAVRQVAVAHVDPEKVEWARALDARYPYRADSPFGVANVFRTGEPELYPAISDDLLAQVARDAEHLEMLRRVGFSSAMLVPLRARGRVLGVISFVSAESGARYDLEAVRFAEDLARSAATAIDNARLYHEARLEIAERSRTEAALRESEARLSGIIGSAMDAIVTVGGDQRILVFNAAAERMFRCPAIEALGQPMERFIPERFRAAHQGYVRGFGETGVTSRSMRSLGALTALRADGEEFPIEATISQVELRGEKYFTVIVRDVTERMRLESALRERAEQLLEADRAKDQFLAMLAHELRNPLAPVRNALEIMRLRELPDPALQRARAVMERQVGHLTRLVDDLLDVSRITRGKVQLQKVPVELGALVSQAAETARPILEERGLRLFLMLPEEPVKAEVDPTRLEQVLGNLLNNAAKYTDRGGEVRVSLEATGDRAAIRVRDTGIGISPELLPRIFDIFTQADRSLDRAEGGLGLGLALVKALTEMHGGTVAVESAGPGEGSEFIVTLPLAGTDPRLRAPVGPPDPAQLSGGGPRPLRILVVEDNIDAAETISELLALWGHAVRCVHDGPSALAAAAEWRPAVVILDIGLPGMSGFEVAERLRQDPEQRDRVLIALTGYGQPEDYRRSTEAGFNHHLVKPVDVEDLRKVIAGIAHRV